MKMSKRLTALVLTVCMILPMLANTALAAGPTVTGDPVSGFTILGPDGAEEAVDSSWEDRYPYGIFALGHSELVVTEGGPAQRLTVYRLGGTTNKASAVILYQPAAVRNPDGTTNYSAAISARDITIRVEDPLPITQYQPWGVAPDPEPTDIKVKSADGVDGQGEPCLLLSLDTDAAAEDFQWYALNGGDWEKVLDARGPELPIGSEDLGTYDFRCVFTLDGVRYCTDSIGEIAYEKPPAEEVPEAPADLERNPPATYSKLTLDESGDYNSVLFEVCFADSEYKKDILISARDDDQAALDKYAAITITGCVGGEVLPSLNTLMLRLADNDDDRAEPSQIGFAEDRVSFDKSAGKASITVRRTGGGTRAVSVDWSLEEGTAKAGTDYVNASGTLYFYGDQTEQTIEIELVNDQIEDLDEKEFTVHLENLLGDELSSIDGGTCTVGLYNTNTGEGLNLASTLYDVQAVDVSGQVTEASGAPVGSGTVTGSQVTAPEGFDPLGEGGEKCTVDWGAGTGGLDPLLYSYGKINFASGSWTSTTGVSLSLSSEGGGATETSVPNMGKLYRSLYAPVYGGAKFASGWDRFWYGDQEYAYTYMRRRNGGTSLKYWDCAPNYWTSGGKVYLSAQNPFYVNDSWSYTDTSDNLLLGVAKYESRGSDGNINASANVTLTRRTFNNDFYLNIYTANDSDVSNVARYSGNNYSGIIQSVEITEGGAQYGKLYEGSTVRVNLGNTHLVPVNAYIVNASGTEVLVGSISGNTATFSNIMLFPDGIYTLRLVLDRAQNIKIDVSTSSEVNADGSPVGGAASANAAAYNLLLAKNTKVVNNQKVVTVGYSPKSGKLFNTNAISETTVPISGLTVSNGVVTTALTSNIQWVNFNLSDKDVILFNGKAYAGNAKIWLETKHLPLKDMTFYFYEEDFLTAERPMRATLDATAVYFDGDGNGKIDGYFDEKNGVFVLPEGSSDRFVAYLDDIDYEETAFRPVVGSDGKVRQYFMRPYYTANPVCLVIPQGHFEYERMQIMPNLITDVTDSSTYEALSEEQKQYRTIVSGKSQLKRENASTPEAEKYTSDDKYKYTEKASAYSYVDIPLGGDKSPASQLADAGKPDGKYGDYMFKDGLAYYYSEKAPGHLGNAVFAWTPDYKGNLLYPFSNPRPIYIANSLAGSRIPITSDLETRYLKTNGDWTSAAPTEETKDTYAVNDVGAYVTEVRAGENGSKALNNYLGSFGGNDTFALVVNEQAKTTGQILSGLGALADEKPPVPETITRGTAGSFPDSAYLQQSGSSNAEAEGDSSGEGDYEEFSSDVDSELFSFNSEMLSLMEVEVDGYEVSFSIGIPVYAKDNGGGTGSASNTLDDTKETAGKVRDFIKSIKNPDPNSNTPKKDAFKKLAGEDLDSNKLKSKSIEFTVTVSLGITLKYNPLDNKYKFSEAALAASVGIEIRLQHRFTPAPIFYVYVQFAAEGSISTGLGQNRTPVLGKAILQNTEQKLYEKPVGSTQSRQYFFTTDQKAFNITFSGKLYMECYEFTDSDGDKTYDKGEPLVDKLSGFSPGYISSDGKEATEIVLKGQNGFKLAAPVVVVLTVMDDGKADHDATATITGVTLIEGVDQELYWSGFHFEIEGSIELGIGVGIEIAKIELFAKASLGIAFTLGAHQGGGEYDPASFDEFNLQVGLGFRIVFLFFNFEMDLIEYHLNYSGDTDKWTHGWSALGGMFGGDSDLGIQGQEGDGKVHVYISPPSRLRAQIYGNNVTYQEGDVDDLAYDSKAEEFQVSGYGSSVNAFKLMDNVETGYDYRIVTVSGSNYVVYTGTRAGPDVAAVDGTRLMLSKLQETDDAYGLVNPIAENSTDEEKAIPVDDDDTGDLDFHAWAEGDKIHVIWVSYASKTDAADKPDGAQYSSADGTFNKTGSTLIIDGETVTADNCGTIENELAEVDPPGPEPVEGHFYTTAENTEWNSETEGEGEGAVTYYFPDPYADLAEARQAYLDAVSDHEDEDAAYQAYLKVVASLAAWKAYFAASDVQAQIVNASQNTQVKHAVFDTTATAADTGFTDLEILGASTGKYYFLPQAAGSAAVWAQSVPYGSELLLQEQLDAYRDYLDDTLTADGSDEKPDTLAYINATKAYRLAYQRSMLSVYGGNSKLTVTAPDGTPYADGVMFVSRHQANEHGDALEQTNEILTNLQVTQIGDAYYLAYVTRQDVFVKDGGDYTDISTISRLYLRAFTIETNEEGPPAEKIVWGEPYLLRTVVNNEENSDQDGVYNSSLSRTKTYIDPYIANLRFLNGALGDGLTGTPEDFEPFGDGDTETFLLFEMNGSTYVIKQNSLISITDPDVKSGTVHPFFTYQQRYGDALDPTSTQNLSSGKNEVVVGVDGDGNIAAVYTGSVPNTVNNAIYIAYWDPAAGTWSDGVMLAMNYMDVYERSVAEGWSPDETEAAYFETAKGGGMTRFAFSNLQIALGRSAGGVDVGGLDTMDSGVSTVSADTAASAYPGLSAALGLTADPGALESLGESYSKAQLYALAERAELQGFDTGSGTAASSELLILTQGLQQLLDEYDSRSNPGATVIAPKLDDNDMPLPGNLGIYAISYGKGAQQVGSAAIRFSYNEFTVGSRLHALVSFRNVGDAAIRGSKDNPVTVRLMLHNGADKEMAAWNITQNIGAGQAVNLSTTDSPCAPLVSSLGEGDYFYLTVSEDEAYSGTPYTYNSSSDSTISCRYQFKIEDKPELGVEGFKSSVKGVSDNGDALIDLSFNVTNRGSKKAEEVFVQFSYLSGFDSDDNALYTPLDLTGSELYVSQQKLITDSLDALGTNDLQNGVLYLGTDSTFYTDDYYISAAKYNSILAGYYSTTAVDGWANGVYNSVTYWYNQRYHISAYAAYTAGQEAVKGWTYYSGENVYYNNSYPSYAAAKTAANAARMAEYLITAAAYDALSASQKELWKQCSGAYSSYYTLKAYTDYADAYAAYQAALADGTQEIVSNYCRSIKGTVLAPPELWKGKITGSFDIRAEVFSQSSNASPTAGLYASSHGDEYYTENNAVTAQVEQTTFIAASPKITLALGSTHRLPVSVRTTTGKAPEITVTEVEDGADELSTLYYLADADTDAVAATATGSVVIVGNTEGSGVIHVVDTVTNTTYAIAYTVAEAGDGINIYNDDAQFTFYNKNGKVYNPGETGQDWKFQALSSWTDKLVLPYLGNLSIGEAGASFTFETKASKISFDMIGSATVTSNKFPGTYTVSGDGSKAPPTSNVIDFRNESSVSHTVTVKITGGQAYFDTLRLVYSDGYTPPSDDLNAPGLYWSRSFPAGSSVQSGGDPLDFTVYALDESGLQSLSFNGSRLPDSAIVKHSPSLWSYSFQVSANGGFTVSATDTNGNATSRPVTVDWFVADVPDEPLAGQKPALTATALKTKAGEDDVDIFTGNVVITSAELTAGYEIKLSATTEHADLSYWVYDGATQDFKPTSTTIQKNSCYRVLAKSNNSYGTWSARILYIDCFEDMPEIEVIDTALTAPNGFELQWTATKSEESTATLNKVFLNKIDLSTGLLPAGAMAHSGVTTVRYGGQYVFSVTDTKGVTGIKTLDLKVPVDLSADGAVAWVHPWSQPVDGEAARGEITVDFTKVTGGQYTPESADSATLEAYHGAYEAVVLRADEYEGLSLPGNAALVDGDPSWLTTDLSWESVSHDAPYTWSDLKAPEDGETKYLLIVRDALNPDSYSTMAWQELTLEDNAVDWVSISSRLGSTATATDGEVYVSAAKGTTGTYEFAILPLEIDADNSTDQVTVYKPRTAEDFKAPGVIKWLPSDWDSAGFTDAALGGLTPSRYQVAIRSFLAADGKEKLAQLSALGLTADNARKALDQVTEQIQSSTASMAANIAEKSATWKEASDLAADLEAVFKDLEAKLLANDPNVTNADVDAAHDAWNSAKTAEGDAETAWRAALTGADDDRKDALSALRWAWLSATADSAKSAARTAYETAVSVYCLDYQRTQFAAALQSAELAFIAAQAAYSSRAAELADLSAAQYSPGSPSWEGLLTGEDLQITVGFGLGTSLRTSPRSSSPSANTGRILVNASGGAPYDSGARVHYQFALLPVEDKDAALDFTGKMADIADLSLDWQFADDLVTAHDAMTFTELSSGWYQVFVRAVYDPDLRDGYDVNANLSGIAGDLDTLRKAYDAATQAAQSNAVTAAANAAHALYMAYAASGLDVDFEAYEAAIGHNPAVLAALWAWIGTDAAEKELKKERLEVYWRALGNHFRTCADETLYDASYAYNVKLTELKNQVARAYAATPGSYDTACYTIVFVGLASGGGGSGSPQPDAVYGGGKAVYTLDENGELSDDLAKQIAIDNKTLETHLLLGNRRVVIPAGALKSADEVSKLLSGFTGGTGNVVQYTDAQGNTRIVSVSLAENGQTAYLYMGPGTYGVIAANSAFSDTTEHWARDSISFAAAHGLFTGVSDTQFAPGATMTRAMLATVLYRMIGSPAVSGASDFDDVAQGSWYADAVRWASANGIVNGVGDRAFAPDRAVTRAEMVTMLSRFMTTCGFAAAQSKGLEDYPDRGSVPDWAQAAFRWAVAAGVISGDEDGLLVPQNNATRAQVATVFERLIRGILS